MKFLRVHRQFISALMMMLIFSWQVGQPLAAATLYWDNDALSGNNIPGTSSGLGGAGTWDTSSSKWWNLTSDTTWTNGTDTAAFWGTAGTVTLGTGITVGGLTFNTTGYVIAGNTLTLGGSTNVITLNNVAAASITSILAGTSGFTLGGGIYGGQTAGTLTLQGNNGAGLTGAATINNGETLLVSGASGNVTGIGTINLNGSGGLSLDNSSTAGGNLGDRVGNTAVININGNAALKFINNAQTSTNYTETIDTLSLQSGFLTYTGSSGASATTGQSILTFNTLSRSGTATVNFAGTNLGVDARNQVKFGAGVTAGTDLGPWAVVNGADFATYDASLGIKAAASTILAAGSNSSSTNFNTTAGSITLTAALNPSYKTLLVTGGTARTTAINGNTVSVGGISSTGATHIISGTGAVQALNTGDALYINVGANALTFSSIIQNVGAGATASSVVMSGAGTLTLGGVNTYTGNTIINSGIVSIAADSGLGVGGGIIFNGSGQLTLSAATVVAAGRTLTINNGALATFSNNNLAASSIAGKITGTGGVIILNPGTTGTSFALSNTGNDFSGPLVIGTGNSGNMTLAVASLADSTSANGAIRLGLGATTVTDTFQWSTAATGALVLNNRQIDLAGTTAGGVIDSSNATAGNSVTVNTDLLISGVGAKTLTLTGTNTGANTFAGKIFDGAGSVISLNKSGAGTWILAGNANTYSGATTVTAGTLSIMGNMSGSSSAVTISSTGTYKLSGASAQVSTGGVTINATGVLTVDNTTASGGIKSNRINTGIVFAGGQFNYNLGGSSGAAGLGPA